MIASTEKSTLGNTYIGTKFYEFKIKDEGLFADPTVITDFQLPWKMDIYTWLDHNANANLCTKQTQKKDFKLSRPWQG